MSLITVNLGLVSPYGSNEVPFVASGRVVFTPVDHGKYEGAFRTVETLTSPITQGVMTPLELTPGAWYVTVEPSKGNPWPRVIVVLEEGMQEPVNIADLAPDIVIDKDEYIKGSPGKSAYDIAVEEGFVGTVDQWLESLKGQDGANGAGDLVYRGIVADNTDVNTLGQGIWTVSSVASANTLLNYPTKRAGTIIVGANSGSGMTTQDVIAHVSSTLPPERYWRTKLLTSNTTYSPWDNPGWVKNTPLNGTSTARINVDTYRNPGLWPITNRTYVDNLPGTGTGNLEVIVGSAFSQGEQRFSERVANDSVKEWRRYSLTTGGWTGIAWDDQTPDIPSQPNVDHTISADVAVSDHATRVEYSRSRRGGSIGTNGRIVIMIRFDHWLVAFRDKCLPILIDNNLVGTLNVNYDNMTNEQNGGGSITWADVQNWNQSYGIEIANHGATHTNVSTQEAIYHEIVDGRRNLERDMPWVAVESWQEHGSAYLVASDIEGDTGLDLGRSLESFTDSYAGRLVMAEHAIVEGKIGGFYWPLTGTPQVGQSHYSIDRLSATESIDVVDDSRAFGRGMTVYLHPGLLDHILVNGQSWEVTYNEDGSRVVTPSGTGTPQTFATDAEMRTWAADNGHIVYQTTEDFRQLCEHLANERDAGNIMVMTSAGGGFADKSHNRRENLLVYPDFRTGFGAWWSGYSNWTVTDPGENVILTSNASATTLNQSMLLYTRFGWAMGATHELVVNARADVETTITLRVEKTNLPEAGEWLSEKTFTVPGDGILRPYRINFTFPRKLPNAQMSVKFGGPNLSIEGMPVLAAI